MKLNFLLLPAVLLISCTSKDLGPPFHGEWTRTDPFGDHQVSTTTWIFRPDGTLLCDGYPPFTATAHYKISSATPQTATLSLTNIAGPQADALGPSLTLTHDPTSDTLSIDGGPALTPAKTPSE